MELSAWFAGNVLSTDFSLQKSSATCTVLDWPSGLNEKGLAMTLPDAEHSVSVEMNRSILRVRAGGRTVAETTHGLLLRETGHAPVQYIPRNDVDRTVLQRSDRVTHCPFKGDAAHFNLRLDDRLIENGAWSYESPHPAVSQIKDHIAFYSSKVAAIEEHPAS